MARSSKEGVDEDADAAEEAGAEADGCAVDATAAFRADADEDEEADDMAATGARCVLGRDNETAEEEAEAERQVVLWSPVDMWIEAITSDEFKIDLIAAAAGFIT